MMLGGSDKRVDEAGLQCLPRLDACVFGDRRLQLVPCREAVCHIVSVSGSGKRNRRSFVDSRCRRRAQAQVASLQIVRDRNGLPGACTETGAVPQPTVQ